MTSCFTTVQYEGLAPAKYFNLVLCALMSFQFLFFQAWNLWRIFVLNDEHTDRKLVMFFGLGWGKCEYELKSNRVWLVVSYRRF